MKRVTEHNNKLSFNAIGLPRKKECIISVNTFKQ